MHILIISNKRLDPAVGVIHERVDNTRGRFVRRDNYTRLPQCHDGAENTSLLFLFFNLKCSLGSERSTRSSYGGGGFPLCAMVTPSNRVYTYTEPLVIQQAVVTSGRKASSWQLALRQRT